MPLKPYPRFDNARGDRRVRSLWRFGPACLLAMVAIPAACAPPNPSKTVKWQEEVKLSTSEVIVVERETRFKPSGGQPFQGSGWAADVMTIRFRYPSNAKEVIEWRTVRHDADTGYSPETPLVLDIERETRNLYLITINGGSKTGCDEYFRYRYENGAWRDDMLPETFETRSPNLFLNADTIKVPSFVNLELISDSGKRKNIRFRQVGPDRCQCGHIGNPVKSGCVQKYNTKKE